MTYSKQQPLRRCLALVSFLAGSTSVALFFLGTASWYRGVPVDYYALIAVALMAAVASIAAGHNVVSATDWQEAGVAHTLAKCGRLLGWITLGLYVTSLIALLALTRFTNLFE